MNFIKFPGKDSHGHQDIVNLGEALEFVEASGSDANHGFLAQKGSLGSEENSQVLDKS